MRLLHTSSLTLEEFLGDPPPYAILSHTWEKEEVLFEDVIAGTAQKKAGFCKMLGACYKARQDGYEWIWIDTCCIQKSSSSELSEAINSMYNWYAQSAVCYVYLQDVMADPRASKGPLPKQSECEHNFSELLAAFDKKSKGEPYKVDGRSDFCLTLQKNLRMLMHGAQHLPADSFTESRWFTRGWTLQELIAPRNVELYSQEWSEIGTKSSISRVLAKATRIPSRILEGLESIESCCVAHRMSWAAGRTTSRVEDRTYSLLGLFQVNMPLLYGEGDRAFRRLQEEILRQQEDYSIFAWTRQDVQPSSSVGLLATSPDCFLMRERSQVPLQRLDHSNGASLVHDLLEAKKICQQTPDYDPDGGEYDHFLSLDPLVQFDARFSSQSQRIVFPAPKSPPTLTSRGLHLSLPVKICQSGSDTMLMAFIYCMFKDKLLCILLSRRGPTLLVSRDMANKLLAVDLGLLHKFNLSKHYALPSGFVSGTGYNPLKDLDDVWPRSLQWDRAPFGVLRVACADTMTVAGKSCVIDCYPNFDLAMKVLYKDDIRVLGFRLADSEASYAFKIMVGFQDGMLWCQLTQHAGTLYDTYLWCEDSSKTAEHTADHRGSRDVMTIQQPPCLVAIVLRGLASTTDRKMPHVLHVATGDIEEHDPWVPVFLADRQLRQSSTVQ